jgi:hypothetical protein
MIFSIRGLDQIQEKIWVGTNSALPTKIINVFHAYAVGGHSGTHATFKKVSKLFWWSGLK